MSNYDKDFDSEPLTLRQSWTIYIFRFAFLIIASSIFLHFSRGWTHTFWSVIFWLVVIGHAIQLPILLYMIWYVKRDAVEEE